LRIFHQQATKTIPSLTNSSMENPCIANLNALKFQPYLEKRWDWLLWHIDAWRCNSQKRSLVCEWKSTRQTAKDGIKYRPGSEPLKWTDSLEGIREGKCHCKRIEAQKGQDRPQGIVADYTASSGRGWLMWKKNPSNLDCMHI
jgi:hypothetical protein